MTLRLLATILFLISYCCFGIALETVTQIPALFSFYGFCCACVYVTLSKYKIAL